MQRQMIALGIVLKQYPIAKKALIEEGRKPEEVEAMPVLQVVVIHPDAPLEVALALHQLLRRDVKHVRVQLVLLLLAEIRDGVLRQVLRGQRERHEIANIFQVAGTHADALQRGLRREDDGFDAVPLGINPVDVSDFLDARVLWSPRQGSCM